MRRIYCHIVLLTIVVLIAPGCQVGAAPLSAQQLQEFIREKQIQPLVVEEVNEKMTVLMYKDTTKLNCHIVWSQFGIKEALRTAPINFSQQKPATEPSTAIYESFLGNDVICLTVNDPRIQKQAHSLEIIFEDYTEIIMPVENQGNMIVWREPPITISPLTNIIIYDKDEKQLTQLERARGGFRTFHP